MKILMTSETYLPRIGGGEIHVKNLFERLNESGNQVILVTHDEGPEMPRVIRIPWLRRNFFLLLNQLWNNSKTADIIHAHYCHRLAFFATIVGKIRRVPTVITLHGMGLLDAPGASRWGNFSHRMYRYWSLNLATYVISTSEDLAIVADRFISRKKMCVILNGYDASLFSMEKVTVGPSDARAKKIILSVRRLVPKNGLHYLVEALPYVLAERTDIHYVAAGDGTLGEYIKDRVVQLGLTEHVTFLGMVDNDRVHEALAEADVVVFPSTAESSSIACAEAMGMGKLVVASRVGGLIELVGSNEERGYLVDIVSWTGSNYDAPLTLPVQSYKNLANAILRALGDSLENNEKRRKAEIFAKEELSWDSIYKKTVDVYKKIK
ncbi:MAG: hypothetical protein RLZZ480_330 [Candidatus Parcubacteria bacterium]|jgi:glycosyltransferase involved in cell wall biosynthesis